MTEKTLHMGTRGIEKMPGWFSWRHQTRAAHDAAVARRNAYHGRAARKSNADDRNAILAAMTPEDRKRKFAVEKFAYDRDHAQ